MRFISIIGGCLIAAAAYGCAASQAAHEIAIGRFALLTGNPALALKHFEQAAVVDPGNRGSPLHESAWTYVGRAYYETKQYAPARQALERALALNPDDSIAQLFVGLVGARVELNQTSRKQIQQGLQAIDNQIDYIKRFTPMGEFWDPTGKLSADLQVLIKAFAAAQNDWAGAIAQVERLALDLENEIDAAQRDEAIQHRGGGSGSGDM